MMNTNILMMSFIKNERSLSAQMHGCPPDRTGRDAFKALLIRYEKLVATRIGLQWLALCTLFCRKLKV